MTEVTDLSWVDELFGAVDRQDWEGLHSYLAPDVAIEAPGFAAVGPEAVSGWMSAFFVAFPDLRHAPTGTVGGACRVAMEVGVTGTHTGDLATPAGTVPPTGRPLDITLGEFWDLDGAGRVTRYRVHFDQLDFLTQLGLAGS